MPLEPTLTTYVVLDLLAWQEAGALHLSPKFQRRSVWKTPARSYLIDTMLLGYPVPPLHIRLVKTGGRTLVREVIDGQQRLRALFDFINGRYRLSNQLRGPWAGRTFDELDPPDAERIQDYAFHAHQYQSIDDATVLEIFARINTNSIQLNAQELRNGRYFGVFKQAVYEAALQHLTFWRETGLMTEAAIARMAEAQLVGELFVLQLDGLQDKKGSLDEFYANLDHEWGNSPITWQTRRAGMLPANYLPGGEVAKRNSVVLDAIATAVGDWLPQSEFKRTPLFYSLYAALYHRIYGLPRFDAPTPSTGLTPAATIRLREALEVLSDLVSERPDVETLRGWQREFLVAASRQTDNISPRRTRLEITWERAQLAER